MLDEASRMYLEVLERELQWRSADRWKMPPRIVFESQLEKYEEGIRFLEDLIIFEKTRQMTRDRRRAAARARRSAGTPIPNLVEQLTIPPSPEEEHERNVSYWHKKRYWRLCLRAAQLGYRMEDLDTEDKRSRKFCIIWRKIGRCSLKLAEQGDLAAFEEARAFKQKKSYLLNTRMKLVKIILPNAEDTELSD